MNLKLNTNTLKQDKLLLTGVCLLALSATVFIFYVLPVERPTDKEFFLTPEFLVCYTISFIYWVLLVVKGFRNLFLFFNKTQVSRHLVLLLLFNISAFALNRTIPVYGVQAQWVVWFIAIESTVLPVYAVWPKFAERHWYVLVPALVLALVFHLYQSAIAVPYIPLSVIGLIIIGISVHILVPFFYVLAIIILLYRLLKTPRSWVAALAGLMVAIVAVAVPTWQWHRVNSTLEQQRLTINSPFSNTELPQWVLMAQGIPINNMTEKYLEAGIEYKLFKRYGHGPFPGTELIHGHTAKTHDPFITAAYWLNGPAVLGYKDRMQVLRYLYHARHESEGRYWTGKDLLTNSVTSNVQLLPAYRLSYTEMILSIRNDPGYETDWASEQEAIYVFQLPEGGVVTSLSLWVNGIEEHGILTSKAKAKKAYHDIVFRQRRDPSVVYWKEGNRVTVKVFPCTTKEDRQFKLGVTAPLKYHNDQLHYRSITFYGPGCSGSPSSINVVAPQPQQVSASIGLTKQNGMLTRTGSYIPDWQLQLPAPPLAHAAFSFQQNAYRMQKAQSTLQPFKPKQVVIDLSAQWADGELEEAVKFLGKHITHVNGLYFYSVNDPSEVLNARRPTFALFPFHTVSRPDEVLVITKGGYLTPNLGDLKGSPFGERLFDYFKEEHGRVRVFDVAPYPSSYMASLSELGVINYRTGSLAEVAGYVGQGQYPEWQLGQQQVLLPANQLTISADTAAAGAPPAPDHLYRLYTYQKLMHQLGRRYFDAASDRTDLVDDSKLANIVTPVSSLIVLETQQDYDRFAIAEEEGTLDNAIITQPGTNAKPQNNWQSPVDGTDDDPIGNAANDNAGAVPEPHEWALIVIGILFVVLIWLRPLINLF